MKIRSRGPFHKARPPTRRRGPSLRKPQKEPPTLCHPIPIPYLCHAPPTPTLPRIRSTYQVRRILHTPHDFLPFDLRFVVPFARFTIPLALPFPFPLPFPFASTGDPFNRTCGLSSFSALRRASWARASNRCSSSSSFSSLSLRSSSTMLRNTKRYAIRRIAQSQKRFRLCRLASSTREM